MKLLAALTIGLALVVGLWLRERRRWPSYDDYRAYREAEDGVEGIEPDPYLDSLIRRWHGGGG